MESLWDESTGKLLTRFKILKRQVPIPIDTVATQCGPVLWNLDEGIW